MTFFVEIIIGSERIGFVEDDGATYKNNPKSSNQPVHSSDFFVDSNDDFDSLIGKLKLLGDGCAESCGSIPKGCTVPHFPRVSSSLREADNLFGCNEPAYFEDTDSCLYSTSIVDCPRLKSNVELCGTFVNTFALSPANDDQKAGNLSTQCHKVVAGCRKPCADVGYRCRENAVFAREPGSYRVRIGGCKSRHLIGISRVLCRCMFC